MSSGPLYEKSAFVAAGIDDEFAEWLDGHIVDVRSIPGVLAAESGDSSQAGDRRQYTWRYAFDSDESLDVFLERESNESYPGARQSFGEEVDVSSRVLREDQAYLTPGDSPSACLNCGAALRGQYCGNCGQRGNSRLISLWELVRDAFGDLFELDSRLWRTVLPLLVRPGLLTADYLAGRRARYMPPFRMYLVLSLLFFVVAFFNPREELALLYAPPAAGDEVPAAEAEIEYAGEESGDKAPEAASEESAESAAEQVRIGRTRIPDDARNGLEAIGLDLDELNERVDEAQAAEEVDGINITIDGDDPDGDGCELEDYDIEGMPEWFQVRFSRDRVQAACTSAFMSEDGRREFLRKVLDNIPLALFILLPLMAFVQALLYPLSRRYYVEHLLFFVHFHAFFFLMLTLQVLWGRLVDSFSGPEWLAVLPIVATSFYIPVYLFRAMRRVYEQSWLLTFFKYLLLLISYFFGFSFMMLSAFLFALASST